VRQRKLWGFFPPKAPSFTGEVEIKEWTKPQMLNRPAPDTEEKLPP
jgi:hypothetical protein